MRQECTLCSIYSGLFCRGIGGVGSTPDQVFDQKIMLFLVSFFAYTSFQTLCYVLVITSFQHLIYLRRHNSRSQFLVVL